jgi:hypothetical protein
MNLILTRVDDNIKPVGVSFVQNRELAVRLEIDGDLQGIKQTIID